MPAAARFLPFHAKILDVMYPGASIPHRAHTTVCSVKLFFSIFKTLVGKEITVELKNDLEICGTLHSVDQYLNFRLNNVHVVNEERFPHMVTPAACPLTSPDPPTPGRSHRAVRGSCLCSSLLKTALFGAP